MDRERILSKTAARTMRVIALSVVAIGTVLGSQRPGEASGPSAVAGGQTSYYVNGTCGDDSWTGTIADCQAPDGPKATIQAAINASQSGDEVVVADGVYKGVGNRDLDFGGRRITVRSQGGAGKCTIDCQYAGRAFILQNNEPPAATIEGFTITHGTVGGTGVNSSGGGVFYAGGSSPTIRNCIFRANNAYRGGAVGTPISAGSLGQITVQRCTFEVNHAGSGGGGALFHVGATVSDTFSDPTSHQDRGARCSTSVGRPS